MIKFLCPAFGDIDQRDNVSRDVYYTAVGSSTFINQEHQSNGSLDYFRFQMFLLLS